MGDDNLTTINDILGHDDALDCLDYVMAEKDNIKSLVAIYVTKDDLIHYSAGNMDCAEMNWLLDRVKYSIIEQASNS